MAAPATLTDVIERLRAEGQLTRNTGTNSIKAVRIELSAQTTTLQEMLKIMQAQEARAQLGRAGPDTSVGGGGSGNGGGGGPGPSPSDTNPILAAFDALGMLGMLGKVAAGAIGSALGVVIGQFKTIRVFFPKTVDKLLKPITDFVDNFRARMTALSTNITTKLTQVGAGITTAITFVEGVFSSAAARINSLGVIGKTFTKTVSYIYDTMKIIVKVFTDVGKMIGGAVKTAFSLAGAASSIMTPLKNFLNAVKSVAGAVGKLFVPLGVVLTLFDTIKGIIDGYTQGGILGALQGGITGFFNSLIFGPLDLIKNLVSWVLEKFGFENASKFLDGFSFTEIFTDIVNGLFGFVKTAWNWLSEKFGNLGQSLSQKWEELKIGFANIGDWMWNGINGVWNWIKDKFYGAAEFIANSWNALTNGVASIGSWIWDGIGGIWNWISTKFSGAKEFIVESWDKVTGGVTSIGGWIWGKVEEVWNWIKNMFGDLLGMFPTVEELKQKLLDALPEGLRSFFDGTKEKGSLPPENYVNPVDEFSGFTVPQMRTGSRGFVDFGKSTLAELHGMEAVVPLNTPAGKFLEQNFDDSWQPVMQRIASVETAAIQQQAMSPTIVVNAPTVSPVNNNVTGPTSVSNNRVTAIGGAGTAGVGLGRFAQ